MKKQIFISIILLSCGDGASGSSTTRAVNRAPIEIINIVDNIKNETEINISQKVINLLVSQYANSISELQSYEKDIISAIKILKDINFQNTDNLFGKKKRNESVLNKINKIIELKVNKMLEVFISNLTLEELKELKELKELNDNNNSTINNETLIKFSKILKEINEMEIEIEI